MQLSTIQPLEAPQEGYQTLPVDLLLIILMPQMDKAGLEWYRAEPVDGLVARLSALQMQPANTRTQSIVRLGL